MIKNIRKIFITLGAAIALLGPITTAAATGSDQRFDDVPSIQRYELVDDGGGAVDEFQAGLNFIKKSGLGLKVNGYCASACTLLLDTKRGIDTCVTPKAKFMFHKPFLARGNLLGIEIVKTIPAVYKTELMWTNEFYKKYPEWVRTEIDRNGGVPSVYTGSQPNDMFIIGFDTLKKHMVICND